MQNPQRRQPHRPASSAASSASSASDSKDEATGRGVWRGGRRKCVNGWHTRRAETAGSCGGRRALRAKMRLESGNARQTAAAKRAKDIASAVALEDASDEKRDSTAQLSEETSSESETLAATPKAVKSAPDNAETRLRKTRTGRYTWDKDTFVKYWRSEKLPAAISYRRRQQ